MKTERSNNKGPRNRPFNLVAPVKGLNTKTALMSMPPTGAVALENFIPFPDRLESRKGNINHLTGLALPGRRLHVYNGLTGTSTLWVTTDGGVYDATAGGAVGAAAIALTNGETIATSIATGAGSYLMLVNGTDTLKQYNGTAWSSVATFGATSTATYSYIETYRQRLFMIKRDSLEIEYLPVNSISGTPTNYPLGAIFRRGGRLVAMATWTIDSGVGPDDHIVIVTSEGEVGVFAGSDPATWAFRGVFYLGHPLGKRPLLKYGGDLLFLCELGLYPLSSALQSTAVDRIQPITENIRTLFNEAATNFFSADGWQIISQADIPLLIVNIPSTPMRKQFVMHPQTGAWTIFTGWEAISFAEMGSNLYFSTSTGVQLVSGTADVTSDIVCTMLQAYGKMGSLGIKQVALVRPYLETGERVSVTLGISDDFADAQDVNEIQYSGETLSLWGTGLWGEAIWSGAERFLQDWQTVANGQTLWKALYLQTESQVATVKYYGSDFLILDGGSF
jgi:hypothetical protein